MNKAFVYSFLGRKAEPVTQKKVFVTKKKKAAAFLVTGGVFLGCIQHPLLVPPMDVWCPKIGQDQGQSTFSYISFLNCL